MMIEFDEYKVKLNGLKPKLDELAASLGIERCKEDIERLHAQIESPGLLGQRGGFPEGHEAGASG